MSALLGQKEVVSKEGSRIGRYSEPLRRIQGAGDKSEVFVGYGPAEWQRVSRHIPRFSFRLEFRCKFKRLNPVPGLTFA